jgi:hypothetical protein
VTADYDKAAVLAQVAERRRRNEERVAELGLLEPDAIAASLREVEVQRRKRRAARAGQLDLGGAA